MQRFKAKGIAILMAVLLVYIPISQQAAQTIAIVWDGANNKLECEAGVQDVTSIGSCSGFGADDYFLFYFNSADGANAKDTPDTYTWITDVEAEEGWEDTPALPDMIYETVKSALNCKYKTGTAGTYDAESGEINILTGYCYDGLLEDTNTDISNAQRIGGEIIYTNAEVDFHTNECKIGVNHLIVDDYHYPYDTTAGTWDPDTELCDAKFDLKDAYVTVKNPKKTIVDLIKFRCYIPGDCIPRKLEIDYDRWREAGIDKNTDAFLYQCIIEADHHSVRKDHNQHTAKDYVLIGDPSTIQDSTISGFKLKFVTDSVDETENAEIEPEWYCETGTVTITKYWFDYKRGYCYRFNESTGDKEILHLKYQTYDLNKMEGIDNILQQGTSGNKQAFIDIKNGICAYKGAVGATEQCTSSMKFDMIEKKMMYHCECDATTYKYAEDSTVIWAPGNEDNSAKYSCDGEVVDVDIVDNKCYKGIHEYTLDTERYWCDGIALAIHGFDIKKWDWGTSLSNNYLIDLFNNLCKEYDHTSGEINQFDVLNTIPFNTGQRQASPAGVFACRSFDTAAATITTTGTDRVVFGGHLWAADSQTAANSPTGDTAATALVDNDIAGPIYIANDSTYDNGFQLSTATLKIDQLKHLGQLDVEWGVVVDNADGITLWNTLQVAAGKMQDLDDNDTNNTLNDFASIEADLFDWQRDVYYKATATDVCDLTVGDSHATLYHEISSSTQYIRPLSFKVLPDCDTTLGTLTAISASNFINYGRAHNFQYMDDTMRIDLALETLSIDTDTSYPLCIYKGVDYGWNSDDMRCYYVNDSKELRAPKEFYYNLQYINYEVVNDNLDPLDQDQYFIDFVQNTCRQQGSPITLELITKDPSNFSNHFVASGNTDNRYVVNTSDKLYCKGFDKYGQYQYTDLNGKTFTYLGVPYITNGSETIQIDLSDMTCKKYDALSNLVATAQFSLEKNFCYGAFYHPLWYSGNNFQVPHTETQTFLDNHTDKIIAVLDVKNLKCYIKGHTTECQMSRQTFNQNTATEDEEITCSCTDVTSNYQFFRNHEVNINFVYLGYKYIESDQTDIFESGYSILSAPHDDDTFVIQVNGGGTSNAHALLFKNGVQSTTAADNQVDESTGVLDYSGTNYDIPITEYRLDLSKWHQGGLVNNDPQVLQPDFNEYLVDWAAMKCYRRGSCNVYILIYDEANDDFECHYGNTVVKEGDLAATKYTELFRGSLILGATNALEFDYANGYCIYNSVYYTLYPRFNVCFHSGNKYLRAIYHDTPSVVTIKGITQFFTTLNTVQLTSVPYVDWRNNLLCYCANTDDTMDDFTYGSYDGETITCGCGTTYVRSIQTEYLQGRNAQIIGYQTDEECDDDTYYLEFDATYDGTNEATTTNRCFFRGYVFSFEISTFTCKDYQGAYNEIDLRGVNYEIVQFPSNILYIADYNYMKCTAPGGNDAHLYYKEATTDADGNAVVAVKECRRLGVNGHEVFNAASNLSQVIPIGEDNNRFGPNLTYFVRLSNVSCWKNAVDTGTQIGTFVEERGTCVNNGITTAYIGYNRPEFVDYTQYFSSIAGLEMIYFITAGYEQCVLNSAVDVTACNASMYYDYAGDQYPELTFKCTCGNNEKIKKFSENDSKLKIMGVVGSRYASNDWYRTIDIDPVLYQCDLDGVKYNYNEKTNSCYYDDKRLFIPRQFYEIYDWPGRSTGTYLIDYNRSLCFVDGDCTPMKFWQKQSYDLDGAGLVYTNAERAYCRRIIDQSMGFIEKIETGGWWEFGTYYHTINQVNAISDEDLACTLDTPSTTGGPLYYDHELGSCVDATQEVDYAVNENTIFSVAGVDNNPVYSVVAGSGYNQGQWDLNINTSSRKTDYIFPALNRCAIHYCTSVATDGTCNVADAVDVGELKYRKDYDGTIRWFCYGSDYQRNLSDDAIVIGGRGLKQIANHCTDLNSLFAERENLSDYWIHVQLEDTDSDNCALIYGIPDPLVWDIESDEYIPATYYETWNGIQDLTGQQGAVTSQLNDQPYNPGSCGVVNLQDYFHTWQVLEATGDKTVFDFVSHKCLVWNTALATDRYTVYDIEPDPITPGKWACTRDTTVLFDYQDFNGVIASNDYGNGGSDLYVTKSVLYKTKKGDLITDYTGPYAIDTDLRTCVEYTAYNTLSGTIEFFDETKNRCGLYDISQSKKYPSSTTSPNQIFVDLGTQTCIYNNIHGHLVEFSLDRNEYFAQSYTTVTSRDSASLAQSFTGYSAPIKCRYYDIVTDPANPTFSVKEFQWSEVFIAGSDIYARFPEATYTSHLNLYLIKPELSSTAELGDTPIYKCYKYVDDENMYDPMSQFLWADLPEESDPNWETYNPVDHKCGADEMHEAYYKIVLPETFLYEVIADTWGNRCFYTSGLIYKLRFDDYGLPNHCIDANDDEDTREYLYFEFKTHNYQKLNNRRTAAAVPQLPSKYLNTEAASPINFPTATTCAANMNLEVETAMCLDTTPTPDEWIDLCNEKFYDDSVSDTTTPGITFTVRDSIQTHGVVDLCLKLCHIKDTDLTTDRDYELVSINEFTITCRDPTDRTITITKYNEQYSYFGNRGAWFSIPNVNEFLIKRIELDLTIQYNSLTETIIAEPSCVVDEETGYTLHYRTDQSSLCRFDDWWCEKTDADGRTIRYYYNDPDNHFVVTTIDNTNNASILGDNDYPFIFHHINTWHNRWRVLVDAFNGYCYFPATPDDLNESLTGIEMTYDDNLSEILASIDNFTQDQIDRNLVINCGTNNSFRLHEIMFLGFANRICVDTCPKGTYKNPETGCCELCMYECDDCSADDRCEDCRDNLLTTSDYQPCGDRCFSDETERQNYADNISGARAFYVPANDIEERCVDCPDKCYTCTDSDTCTECEVGYALYVDGSVTSCVSQTWCDQLDQYYVLNTGNKHTYQCNKCDQTKCGNCVTTDATCTSCLTGKYLSPDNTCGSQCIDGTYLDTVYQQCLWCDESCDKCEDGVIGDVCKDSTTGDSDTDECQNYVLLSGDAPFYRYPSSGTPFICTNLCPTKQYLDNTTKTCLPCDPSCATCSSDLATDCLTCTQDKVFNQLDAVNREGECITQCPIGMFNYKVFMDTSYYIVPRTPNQFIEFTRYQSKSQCQYEYENNVVEKALVPQFCVDCASNCESCNGPTILQCSDCKSGFFMVFKDGVAQSCSATCPDGYYADTGSRECRACRAECPKCTSDSVCTECIEGLFLTTTGTCASDCGSGYFKNVQTGDCEICDTSVASTCVELATRATSCTGVAGKPKLNTIYDICQPAPCPDGTYDSNNSCIPCGTDDCSNQGDSNGICDAQCETCYDDDTRVGTECLTCAESTTVGEIMFLKLDDRSCVADECPEGYRIHPEAESHPNQCQPCKALDKTCDVAGAVSCTDVDPSQDYVVKGWPVHYCIADTNADECDVGWFEEDFECKQCSEYCGDCTGNKYFCDAGSCPGTSVRDDFCFSGTDNAQLCLCDLDWEYTMDETLMELTIKFDTLTNVDWNYFKANKNTILGDKQYKDELELGKIMKARYDTKEYIKETSQSEVDIFLQNFSDYAELALTTIDTANLRYQEKLGDIYYPDEDDYVSEIDFDETQQFGEQEAGEDLIQVMFEYQNWSVFGDYSYQVVYDSTAGREKQIIVQLGQDHTYNPFQNRLTLREKVMRRNDGCTHPYRQNLATSTQKSSLPTPVIHLTTSYGGDPRTPASIGYCGNPEVRVTYSDFPKNVPLDVNWSLFDDLIGPDSLPDLPLLLEVNSDFASIEKETTKYQFPASIARKLVGFTAKIRVEATPFFSADTAINTLELQFANIGNYQVSYLNQFTEFRFQRDIDVWSPSFKLSIPPCLLEEMAVSEKQLIDDHLTFDVQYYTTADCTGSGTSLQFDKGRMAFKISARTFDAYETVCVQVTTPITNTDVNTLTTRTLEPKTYQFMLIPEPIFPLITTTFGNYIEFEHGQDIQIPFSVVYDSDGTLQTSYICRTKCGEQCDYYDETSVQQKLVATFDGTDNDRSLNIAANQIVKDNIIYNFTIRLGYSQVISTKTIQVKIIDKYLTKLEGEWAVSGVNSQQFASAGDEGVFQIQLQGDKEKVPEGCSVSFIYDQQDLNGDWQNIPIQYSDGTYIEKFKVNQNIFKIVNMEAERQHRVIADAKCGEVVGRFVYGFSTNSGIDITFATTPLTGTTATLYSFSVNRSTLSTTALRYTWIMINGEDEYVIGDTNEDEYQGYIPYAGTSSDNSVIIRLNVKNIATETVRTYENVIVVTQGVWTVDALQRSHTLQQQEQTVLGLSSQTDLSVEDVTAVLAAGNTQITEIEKEIDQNDPIVISRKQGLLESQFLLLNNNANAIDDQGIQALKDLTAKYMSIDSALSSSAPGKDQVYPGVRIITTKTWKQRFLGTQASLDMWDNGHAQSINEIPENELISQYRTQYNYLNILCASVSSSMTGGEEIDACSSRRCARIHKVDLNNPPYQMFYEGLQEDLSVSRRLQEEVQVTTTDADGLKNYECSGTFQLGPSTLSGYPNLVVHLSKIVRESMDILYVPEDDESGLGTGTPLCDPFEFSMVGSTTTDDTFAEISIIDLDAQTDQEKFSVCFTLSSMFEEEIEIRRYNPETQVWDIEGEFDDVTSDIENNMYCQRVGKTGIYAIYQKIIENEKRFYEGFLLYCMLIIDILLIVGVIVGFKLDKSGKSGAKIKVDQTALKAAADDASEQDKLVSEGKIGEKEYDAADDTAKPKVDPKVDPNDDTAKPKLVDESINKEKALAETNTINVVPSNPDHNKPKDSPKFCEAFQIYHRMLNLYFSSYHELKRPSRVFSFALQLALLTNIIGVLTFVSIIQIQSFQALDFGETSGITALEATVGYACAFVALRIGNIVFYKSLLYAQRWGGARRIVVLIVLAFLYLIAHASGILVTLYMSDEDFTTWTIAFFVTIVVDVIIWELLVTCYQVSEINRIRMGKKPIWSWQVSIALKNRYIK